MRQALVAHVGDKGVLLECVQALETGEELGRDRPVGVVRRRQRGPQ